MIEEMVGEEQEILAEDRPRSVNFVKSTRITVKSTRYTTKSYG